MLVNIHKMLKSEIKILITGGGSGGHLSVADALIRTLINDYNIPNQNICYIGSDLGMEGEKKGKSLDMKYFNDLNIKKYFIRAGKLQRRVSLSSILLPFRTVLGFFDSIKILFNQKPTLVISTGGFVSVPVCIAAYLFNKPIYLHEQTASVGLSNRIVGIFAKRIYVSFRDSLKYFNRGKSVHIGNIVRKDIFVKNITNQTDRDIVNLFNIHDDKPVIYVSGGSLGSHLLNEKIFSCIDSLLDSYRVLLQTGDNEILRDFDKGSEIKKNLIEEKQSSFVIKKYIDSNSIGYVLNNMDIFVGRSGANSVYELGVLKKFALLIPIPWVTHNEQYLNAKVLEEIGLANILEEKYLNESNIKEEIEKLRERIKVRRINADKVESVFPTNATTRLLEDVLNENNKKQKS